MHMGEKGIVAFALSRAQVQNWKIRNYFDIFHFPILVAIFSFFHRLISKFTLIYNHYFEKLKESEIK